MFEFASPRVIFGPGSVERAGEIARALGQTALVVTGRSNSRAERLIGILTAAHVSCERFVVAAEPSVDLVMEGALLARTAGAQVIVAIGGGSALDTGKAIAAMATNPGEIFDYLETIGRARPLARPALPGVAIPTTAGTGSEVTRNAVVSSPAHRVKVSLRDPSMLPRVAIVDPSLALDLPPDITAATGLDALTQLIEPYVSKKANPMTDALASGGIRRVAGSLRRAVEAGHDLEARSDMAMGALSSGLCLANAALGAVHGLAGPLGGLMGAPHGLLCAALLPHVMAANVAALRRAGASPWLKRYDEVGRLLTGSAAAAADDGVEWVRGVTRAIGIGRLGEHGLTDAVMADVIEPALRASSMKGNPVELSPGELRDVLEQAR